MKTKVGQDPEIPNTGAMEDCAPGRLQQLEPSIKGNRRNTNSRQVEEDMGILGNKDCLVGKSMCSGRSEDVESASGRHAGNEELMEKSPGTFSFQEPLYHKQTCKHGHRLHPQDEQFFSGILANYQEFDCPSNATTFILGGAMRIICNNEPMKVRARISRFEDFEKIADQLTKEGKVMISKKYLNSYTLCFRHSLDQLWMCSWWSRQTKCQKGSLWR